MQDHYPVQFTVGQTLFIVFVILLGGLASFYLGARFGPEMLWDISIDRVESAQILPQEKSIQEIEALIKANEVSNLSFHQELEQGDHPQYIYRVDDGTQKAVVKTHAPQVTELPEVSTDKEMDAKIIEQMILDDLDE